jgi:YVTN family beta-propeller protein
MGKLRADLLDCNSARSVSLARLVSCVLPPACFTVLVVCLAGAASTANAYCAYVTSAARNVLEGSQDTISVIDTATNAVVSNLAVGIGPVWLAITPGGRFAYVANCGRTCWHDDAVEAAVSVIDTGSNAVVRTVQVGSGPFGVGIGTTPNGERAYVANQAGNSVSVLDTSTMALTTTITFDWAPYAVSVAPNGPWAYVSSCRGPCPGSGSVVSVIDTSTDEVQTTVPDIDVRTVSPNGLVAYGVNQSSNAVLVIDTEKLRADPSVAVIKTIPAGNFPWEVAVTPGGRFAYVANCGNGCFDTAATGSSVMVIDTALNTVVNTMPVADGNNPWNVAITPDGRFAYVTNGFSNTVSVIDTATALTDPAHAVTTTVPVGPRPFGIAIASLPMCVDGHPTCVGDCGVDRQVTVDELLTMVNIALGNADASACPAGDANHDGQITIDEILTAVNGALNGC